MLLRYKKRKAGRKAFSTLNGSSYLRLTGEKVTKYQWSLYRVVPVVSLFDTSHVLDLVDTFSTVKDAEAAKSILEGTKGLALLLTKTTITEEII